MQIIKKIVLFDLMKIKYSILKNINVCKLSDSMTYLNMMNESYVQCQILIYNRAFSKYLIALIKMDSAKSIEDFDYKYMATLFVSVV